MILTIRNDLDLKILLCFVAHAKEPAMTKSVIPSKNIRHLPALIFVVLTRKVSFILVFQRERALEQLIEVTK